MILNKRPLWLLNFEINATVIVNFRRQSQIEIVLALSLCHIPYFLPDDAAYEGGRNVGLVFKTEGM